MDRSEDKKPRRGEGPDVFCPRRREAARCEQAQRVNNKAWSRREQRGNDKETVMTISEKVAYIQGMFVGMELDKSEMKVARVLSEVLDVLREVGQQLDSMDAAMDQFDEELDTLGGTVAELEEAVFDDEDEQDADFDDLDDDEEDFFEIPCPTCGEDLVVDDEALAAGLVECPVCGGKFALSFEEEANESSGEE